MSHNARETSRTRGAPIALYLFTGAIWTEEMIEQFGHDPGPFGPYAFTSSEQPIIHDGITYTPWPITRGEIVSSGTLDKAALTVELAEGTELAAQFLEYPPNQVVNLFIRDGHVGDDPDDPNNFMVVWSGRVLSCAHPPLWSNFTCEPISTSMRRPGLRRNYQLSCPHVLYGPQCRADRDAATIIRTVASVSRSAITLAPGWDSVHPRAKYVGGMVGWTRAGGAMELRSILRAPDGVTLRLSGNTRGLTAGMDVRVILGCSRNVTKSGSAMVGDCVELHDNIHNYGGQPFIPLTSPLGGVNNFN